MVESLQERWITEVCFLGKKYKKFVLEGCREKIDFLIPICNSAVFVSTFLKRQGGAAGGLGVGGGGGDNWKGSAKERELCPVFQILFVTLTVCVFS